MRAYKDLTQSFGTLRKGFAYNSPFGKFPINQMMMNVAAASDTAVHAAVTLASGAVTVVTTEITNPVTYRCVRIKGNQSGVAGTVEVVGTDFAGRTVTESIVANGSAAVEGSVPFKTVTKITMPARVGVGDTISVGINDKLGLIRPIAADADVISVKVGGVAEAVAASDADEGTFTPTTATNGTNDYEVFYNASQL